MWPTDYSKFFIGAKFFHLTIEEVECGALGNPHIITTRCECGSIRKATVSKLQSGLKSCGCKTNAHKFSHGMWHHPLYHTWKTMRSRCLNKRSKDYVNYGSRGISICDRWLEFENFASDVGNRPSPSHTLERIDNNLGYDPLNVRWATRKEQSRNKRNNVWVTAFGKCLLVSDWASIVGLSQQVLRRRIKSGLPADKVLFPFNGFNEDALDTLLAGHKNKVSKMKNLPELG